MITISRLYDDYNTAARVYNDLDKAGISTSDISIVANNSEGWFDENAREPGRIDKDGDGVDDRTEGAATGAGIGGGGGGLPRPPGGAGLVGGPRGGPGRAGGRGGAAPAPGGGRGAARGAPRPPPP